MRNKFLVLRISALMLIFSAGCSSSFYDVNTNPNAAVDVPADLILASALVNTGSYVNTNFDYLNLWMGYWNWSGNYSINSVDKNYQFTNSFRNNTWASVYTNQLNNYDAVDKKAATAGQPLLQGMAKIMKSFCFQYLVDTYGNVPYTDALNGTGSILPKYDDAQTIYKDLIVQIDNAFTLFNKGAATYNPAGNDILFGGDISMWQKFGNSVKLKILLRQSEVAAQSSYITTELAKIKASGYGFLGAGQSAGVNPGYVKAAGKLSPFWGTYGFNESDINVENYQLYRANLYSINFLNSTKDSFRLPQVYAPVGGKGSIFAARYFGAYGADVVPNTQISGFGPGLLQTYNQNAAILSSNESLFDQAEATFRGWIAGDAKTLYQAAVTESFINLKVQNPTASAKIYYSQTGVAGVNYDVETNKLALVVTQKWASLNSVNPFEAWCDYRRLGYPASLPISKDPTTSVPKIPIRLLYPATEYSYNTDNVTAQGTVSQFTTKIFWAK